MWLPVGKQARAGWVQRLMSLGEPAAPCLQKFLEAAALHLSHPWEKGFFVPCAVWVKRRTQRPDMTEAVNLTDVFACPAAWCFAALAMTAIGTVDR